MAKSIIYLILFSCGLIWVIVDLFRVKHKKLDKEYKALYVENKILLGVICLAIVIMHAEKIWG